MQSGEFNLGQMLRDANIFSVEDLESAMNEAQTGDESLAEVVHKGATWESFRQLMTTDIFARRMGEKGRALQQVLREAGCAAALHTVLGDASMRHRRGRFWRGLPH